MITARLELLRRRFPVAIGQDQYNTVLLFDIIKLVIRKPTIKLSLSYIMNYSYISPYKRLLLITCARCEMIMCRFHAFYNVKRTLGLYLDKTSTAHFILTL